MYVYLNDRLVPRSEAVVSVFDHGFLYGDGVYETMRCYDGVVFMLDEHLRRLARSASMIRINLPADSDSLKLMVYETLQANKLRDAYIRLTVSRGYGPIGLDPELCPSPTLVIMAEAMKQYPAALYENGIRVAIPSVRRNLREALNPEIKSLNFLNNILAKIEAAQGGAYEAVMLNASGALTEGSISNLFFSKGGVLCTPSIECGILDGITRGIVLELAVKEGLTVKAGEFGREDIYSAEEVFLTNTTMEVMPVSGVDDARYAVGGITRLLHKAYRQEVKAYVEHMKAQGPSIWGYDE
ncbi:MAG: branched-chain-amino-acid transaminase [Thermodesulfovibrionales bacterium]|nr:branched-chain-amino-acid transaminase [Thermodesulfovibrionales bacterium]